MNSGFINKKKLNQQLEEIREKRQNKVAGIFKYVSTIMGVFYIISGVIFFLFPFIPNISLIMKFVVSGLLIAYGIFRLFRALKS